MYLKVLLLDDNKNNIQRLSLVLRNIGYIPLFSQSTEQTLAIVKQQQTEILALIFSPQYAEFIKTNTAHLHTLAPQLKLFILVEKALTIFLETPTFTQLDINTSEPRLEQLLQCPISGRQKSLEINKIEEMKKQIANSHILLVEDDNINQMVAKHILEEANICVSTAQNGREAVDILNAAPSAFDLILMDIQMPILDGHNATRAIRKLTEVDSDLPIIAMTGHSMDCEKNKCVESGMNDHISKPLNAQQMYSSIAKWLANKP